MATINGTPINFGFQGAMSGGAQGINITGVTGILQSLETTKTSDVEKVKDGNGNEVVHAFSNAKTNLTLEAIISGASLAATLTGVSYALQNPGTILAVSACTSAPNIVGLSWEVQDAKVSQSNTTAAKVSLSLSYCAGITAVAS
jgi:hypothetical protein